MILPWQIASGIAAAIGAITGIIQDYLSKQKKEKVSQPSEVLEKEEEVIADETIRVGGYGSSYEFKLRRGESTRGEISSDNPINVHFVDENNFNRWLRDRSFTSEDGTDGIFKTLISYIAPKGGMWYLALDMSGRKSAKVKVHLFK